MLGFLLNACSDVQASSNDVYECLLCNSIEGNSTPSNLSRQDGNSLNVKLMSDELNRHEIFFSNCNYYDTETLNNYCVNSKTNGLLLMHFNVRSL